MGKRLKRYLQYMETFKTTELTGLSEEKLEQFKSGLLVQIGFFQHERLIHLIVTALFAILSIISVVSAFVLNTTGLYLLTGLFLLLLLPYIQHYYILENGVQKLYDYYDLIELGSLPPSRQKLDPETGHNFL